jgi:hypothetical protein
MSEFWDLVETEFGRVQGRTLTRDHVIGVLGHRTAEQSLADGQDPRRVWWALCDDFDVPSERRWGQDGAVEGARR